MKRLMLAATAVLTLATSVAAPAAMAQPGRGYDRSYNDHRDHRYRDNHRDSRVVVHKETRIYRDRPNKWHVGDRFGSYRNYREVDYRSHRLKAPPRGYHYVRDNNTGEIILAAIATGLIASIILN